MPRLNDPHAMSRYVCDGCGAEVDTSDGIKPEINLDRREDGTPTAVLKLNYSDGEHGQVIDLGFANLPILTNQGLISLLRAIELGLTHPDEIDRFLDTLGLWISEKRISAS